MEYLLYELADRADGAPASPAISGTVVEFSPFNLKWFPGVLKAGGTAYAKSVALAAWAGLFGAAKFSEFRVYGYVSNTGQVLHYSVLCPASMHLPWLVKKRRGKEIGGCFTVTAARGKKIYPYVLRQISESVGRTVPLFMIVEAANTASRAGMERAGFVLANKLRRKAGSGTVPKYLRCTGE